MSELGQFALGIGQMYEKDPVSRMPPTGFYGYLIENT